MSIIVLMEYKDLPDSIPDPGDSILEVCISYKYIKGFSKNNDSNTVPNYGGSTAHYSRNLDFVLDRSSLIKSK